MKKKILIGLLACLFVSTLFAQNDSKKVFLGLHSFVTEPSKTWTIYDGYFTKVDPMSEEYTFIGSFVVKVLMTNSRYDFACTVKNTGDDINLEITKMESYAVDKNRNFLSSSKVINTAKKVSDQYAAQMKDEIKARIANVSDDSVESEYTKLITHPSITTPMTKTMTALALKKFINENINGKQVELDIVLSSIDENRNPITNELEELNYKAWGNVNVYKEGFGRFIITETTSVSIYSNNDKLLSAKPGDTYKAKGTVSLTDLRGMFWSYSINEE